MPGQVGPDGAGGGITNDAPVNAIPVTADASGNLGPSPITWNGDTDNPVISATANVNSSVTWRAAGIGVQLALYAADGDATHVGGEIQITTGDSAGQNSGDLTIATGSDSGGGDSGNITIKTGTAIDGDNGGNSGEIAIRAGGNDTADSQGGAVNISGGTGRTGGGSVVIAPGARTVSGSHGTVQVYSADSNQGLEVNNSGVNVNDKLAVAGNVGFYGTAPVARPNIDMTPTAQEIVDALVLLGLVTQS